MSNIKIPHNEKNPYTRNVQINQENQKKERKKNTILTEIWSDQKLGVANGSTSTSFEFRYKDFFNFFPFLLVQLLLMYGFRTIKNNNKRIKKKIYTWLMKKNEKLEPFNKPKYVSEEERRKVCLKQKLGFFLFLLSLFSLFPPTSSGFWFLHSFFSHY